ncbi:arylsulfatase [Pelagicoccus sp. SDUM812005]|uniref:arylsulfatase n=1 Tax=Pelagicoccus sp. SDUM812005 TaxID=3041257 RepID=UPI00280F3B2F|nr:arylsulfatase [Pelagicoccus sp. SDUM812005]MDQ8181155.1 arylsulfatase [Pelagicoccus sp. SDUM812005]
MLIVADDMGYSDAGCFGGEIDTPNLDKLAKEGIRFERFYNGGMCVASRTSLLSGRWYTDVGLGIQKGTTLPEVLRMGGYRNYAIGKWHLKGNPVDRGFHRFFGFLDGFSSYYVPSPYYRLDHDPIPQSDGRFYSTEVFANYAINFITLHQESTPNAPFFAYLAFNAPHNPLQAPPEAIAKYRGRYLEGWEAIRKQRHQRQKQLGLVPPHQELPPYPSNLPQWSDLSDAQKDLEDLRMATYAAMIDIMDQNIGRVLQTLDHLGIDDNTLVLFTSDNGADPFALLDEMLLSQGLLPGDKGSNFQPGFGWAWAANTPLRHYKISQHEGGVASGLIARWPAMIRSQGRIERNYTHMVDLMPTLLELAEIPRETVPSPMAGHSFSALLHSEQESTERVHFFQFLDNRGIRKGPWRLSEVDGNGWELHNLITDPNQAYDISEENPHIVAELDRLWVQWWKHYHDGAGYVPTSSQSTPHYHPQGDRGSGKEYVPAAMPESLKHRYPIN